MTTPRKKAGEPTVKHWSVGQPVSFTGKENSTDQSYPFRFDRNCLAEEKGRVGDRPSDRTGAFGIYVKPLAG